MEPIINQMLAAYPAVSITDKKNALKEVMQEIVLCGLSRTDFLNMLLFTVALLCAFLRPRPIL